MREIHFYLPRPKNQWNTIRFRFTLNYKDVSRTTNLKIKTKNWDFKKQRAKASYKLSSMVNTRLFEIENDISSILQSIQFDDELTREGFKAKYDVKVEKPTVQTDIFTFYENNLIPDKIAEGLTSDTIKAHRNSKNRLAEYCSFIGIKEDSLTISAVMEYGFYTSYLKYLNLDCGFSLNYQGSLIKNIKCLINHARTHRLHNVSLPRWYKKPTEAIEPVVLERNELVNLEECKGLTPLEDKARDWFLISCFTGLRVSDFLELNRTQINYEKNTISLRTTKNHNKFVHIPMAKVVLRVLQKNSGLPTRITEAELNGNIKTACAKAKINKEIQIERKIKSKVVKKRVKKYSVISAHCGRRTFATHAYNNKLLDLNELRLITAHGSITTLMTYIKVDSKKAAKKMQKNMDRLGI